MRIGLLGGTFNPIHRGHLALARECQHQLELDKVVFVPAYLPPHKEVAPGASDSDRLNMTRLATEGEDSFEVSTYEIDSEDVSYSIETIKHFRQEYAPDAEIFFLTGADAAEGLSGWKDVDKILELTTFVIATRPPWQADDCNKDKIKIVEMPPVEASSHDIRDRIQRRESVDHLVPESVAKYIREKGLYSL